MTEQKDLTTPYLPNWCAGCGNFSIWSAFKNAAVKEGWDNTNSALVAGIGCHGHIINFVRLSSFEGLHGRALPVATGMKMANHRLNVFVFTGDGDSLGEGGNHLMHTCRRNHDITILLHNNGVYALTTGQTSPASSHGYKSKSTPAGNPDQQLFPASLAIASGATFVAREYSTNINKLTDLIIEANNHRGLAVIDILQPCVTFNHECTHTTYQDNTYHLGDDYDPTNKKEAFMKAMEWGVKQIPLGIIYREEKPSYESSITQIKEKPLIEHNPQHQNVEALLKKYT